MARIAVFYHYLFPDKVVSSVLFSELCAGLAEHGWQVSAYCGNRGSGRESTTYPQRTTWRTVDIRRIWRPDWNQSSSMGRLLNAIWMIASWGSLAFRWRNVPDVILVGTDPIMSVVITPLWRLIHPRIKIVHWCFDVYPEAAYADGLFSSNSLVARFLEWLMKHSYLACDLIVDLGPCMRELLLKYTRVVPRTTIVPWALSEPPHAVETPREARHAIFGSAELALMYSGTMGRAHSFEDLLELMKVLRGSPTHLVLSVQGNREKELRAAITTEDVNVSFVASSSVAALQERLATADIHVVSLQPEWTGLVVPSKFFGALAVGRPILFCGSAESAIARLIEEYQVGWILTPGKAAEVADRLIHFTEDASSMTFMREKCHNVYRLHFSRDVIIRRWNSDLRGLLAGTNIDQRE